MKRVQLRHLAAVPITNGLGLSGEHDNAEWPRYVRTMDIATSRSLRADVFASQPPAIAQAATLQRGDIVATAAGATIGKSMLYLEDIPACYAGFLVRFRANGKTDQRFVSYWMQSAEYWAQIEQGAVRSTIDNFSAYKYRALSVPAIDLAEQRRIADFLDDRVARIDQIIAARREQLTRLAASLDAEWDTADSEIALTCPSVPIRRVLRSIVDGPFGSSLTSSHYRDSGVRVVRLGNIGIARFKASDAAYISNEHAEQLAAHTVRRGDILMAGLGDDRWPLGRCAVAPDDLGPAIVKADCYRIRLTDRVATRYAATFLSGPRSRSAFRLLARGSTRARLNTDVARAVHVPLASGRAQERYVARVDEAIATSEIGQAELERSMTLLAEYKQAMITAAVTGELDVTTAGSGIRG